MRATPELMKTSQKIEGKQSNYFSGIKHKIFHKMIQNASKKTFKQCAYIIIFFLAHWL